MQSDLMNLLTFAQDGAPAAAPGGGMYQLVFMSVTIVLMFYFMLIRPKQRLERERKTMLSMIKKNDHVETVGGIKGVVANVKPDEEEIVLKVDEATGTKLRVRLSSIARVEAAAESAASESKES